MQAAPLVSTIALIAVTIYVLIDSVKDLNELKEKEAAAAAGAEGALGAGGEVDSKDEVNVTVMWVFASINLILDFINVALFFLKKDEEGPSVIYPSFYPIVIQVAPSV